MISTLPDVSRLKVRDLLRLEEAIIAELRQRRLVRTGNKPLGDIAEQIVLAARGGLLEPNSTKSHDITDATGRRIQIKAITVQSAGRSGMFSSFRSYNLDSAVFLVFTRESFELTMGREVSAVAVEAAARYSAHINGSHVTLRQVENLGLDVTDEMRLSYAALDG